MLFLQQIVNVNVKNEKFVTRNQTSNLYLSEMPMDTDEKEDIATFFFLF